MIAALYVATNGCYFGLPNVDPWDEPRDARRYTGPWPVVAHPPCSRYCRLASQVEQRTGRKRGDDGGIFAAALASVRKWGGVLEHPAASTAFYANGLLKPLRGSWQSAGDFVGWTTEVEQGHYGHRARKTTWLYAVGCDLPALNWGVSVAKITPRPGRDPSREQRTGTVQRMGATERRRTPTQFRDLLILMAESAVGWAECTTHGGWVCQPDKHGNNPVTGTLRPPYQRRAGLMAD